MAATLAKLVSAIVGILMLPMVMHYIGKEQFGLWMVVSSLVIWMQLADFGIGNGLVNALAEANGRDDPEVASGYLSTALAATTGLALLCLPLLYAVYLWMPWERVLNINDPNLGRLAADAFAVVGVCFVVNIPLSLVGRAYLAYQRGYVTHIAQGVASVATFVGTLVALHTKLEFLWLVGISAGFPILANVALWLCLHRMGLPLELGLYRVRSKFLSRVSASSIPLFLFQCGALLVNQLVNVMIANLSSLSMVADFNVVYRIYLFVFSLAAAISSPFYPAIRDAFERGDIPWVIRAIGHGLWIRLLATLPFGLLLLLFGDSLVLEWVGAESHAIGTLGWACVVSTLSLSAASSLLSEVLSGLDDIWSQIGLVMVSAVVVLGGMYFFIPIWNVSGVFIAMSLSTLLPIVWSSRRLRSRHFAAQHL